MPLSTNIFRSQNQELKNVLLYSQKSILALTSHLQALKKDSKVSKLPAKSGGSSFQIDRELDSLSHQIQDLNAAHLMDYQNLMSRINSLENAVSKLTNNPQDELPIKKFTTTTLSSVQTSTNRIDTISTNPISKLIF